MKRDLVLLDRVPCWYHKMGVDYLYDDTMEISI